MGSDGDLEGYSSIISISCSSGGGGRACLGCGRGLGGCVEWLCISNIIRIGSSIISIRSSSGGCGGSRACLGSGRRLEGRMGSRLGCRWVLKYI